jgi:hypothetical protein
MHLLDPDIRQEAGEEWALCFSYEPSPIRQGMLCVVEVGSSIAEFFVVT